MDDMLVKSVKAELHITHLVEAFQVLKIYNMKLNPAKCAFRVSAENFIGFIVNSRGIEANPDKIKAMLDMLPPSNIKEIQRLTGRIATLSLFVSKASDKCLRKRPSNGMHIARRHSWPSKPTRDLPPFW